SRLPLRPWRGGRRPRCHECVCDFVRVVSRVGLFPGYCLGRILPVDLARRTPAVLAQAQPTLIALAPRLVKKPSMQSTMQLATETTDETRRSNGPMVELRQVDVVFGRNQVLRRVELSVPRGQTLAIIG